VGAAYGQMLELAARHRGLEQGGHLAVEEALGLKTLDFMVAPPGDVVPHACLMATGSVALAKKALLPASEGDGLEAAAESLEQYGLATGGAVPEGFSTATGAEVAVIVDDESAAYFGAGNPVKRALLAGQMQEVRKLGAPVDVWLMSDLLAGHLPEYTLYLFLDAFRVDEGLAPRVMGLLGPGRRVAVWMCAPGGIGAGFNGRNMRNLTGISTSVEEGAGALTVKLTGAGLALGSGLAPGLTYGVKQPVAPQFVVVGGDVRVLGVNSKGQPALVATETGENVSVFSAAPGMPAELLRALARGAGVHIYNDRSDRFYCTQSLVAVHAEVAGRRTIRLAAAMDVTAWPSGETVAKAAREIGVEMAAGETRVYLLATPEAPGD
jgi:hypothetical protein